MMCVTFKYLLGSAFSQQIRGINKIRTSYLSRVPAREASAKYHARGNLHTLRRSHPSFSEAVRANISRVNRRPFSTARRGAPPMADIIDTFIRACGKQMADAIHTQNSTWMQNGLSSPASRQAQLSAILKLCKTRKTTWRIDTQTRSLTGMTRQRGREDKGQDGRIKGYRRERERERERLLRYLNEAMTFQP